MAALQNPTGTRTGRCLCGQVTFEFTEDKDGITACHCGQCRKWSGHFWASHNAAFGSLKISSGDDQLSWFRASDYARRGFCKNCGSALFWHGDKLDDYQDRIAIAAGAIDDTSGISLSEHIFVADKGDYYDIQDGLPQSDTD